MTLFRTTPPASSLSTGLPPPGLRRGCLVVAILCLLVPNLAQASLITTDPVVTTDTTAPITFSEYAPGAYAYLPYQVSGGLFDALQIIFGSYFQGQVPIPTINGTVNIAGPTAPMQPLQLLYDQNDYIQIVNDPSSSNSPVLAGGPIGFRQPVSILFSSPIPVLVLTAGFLDNAGALSIDAYDVNGNGIGTVVNTQVGFQTFGLSNPGGPLIAGVTIQSTDPGGFAIDNVSVASTVSSVKPVPEPPSVVLLALGLAGVGLVGRRRPAARLAKGV